MYIGDKYSIKTSHIKTNKPYFLFTAYTLLLYFIRIYSTVYLEAVFIRRREILFPHYTAVWHCYNKEVAPVSSQTVSQCEKRKHDLEILFATYASAKKIAIVKYNATNTFRLTQKFLIILYFFYCWTLSVYLLSVQVFLLTHSCTMLHLKTIKSAQKFNSKFIVNLQ